MAHYEDTLNAKMNRHEKALEALHLDMWIIYNQDAKPIFGQVLALCNASDSNLIGLECWCAECKEESKLARKYAKEIKACRERAN
jgi:hypothetical protein